jgi:hypothetical protein
MINSNAAQAFIHDVFAVDFYYIIAFLFSFIIAVGIVAAFVKIVNNRS